MKLFASDLDGTLIPLEKEPRYQDAIFALGEKLQAHQVDTVYVTGRRLELTLEAMEKYSLPPPRYLITDVGTGIYTQQVSEAWTLEPLYAQQLRSIWQGKSGEEVSGLLPEINGMRPQEAICQGEFKRSYYLELGADVEEVRNQIFSAMKKEGIEVQIIYSVDPLRNLGLIDILPEGTSKLSALNFLIKHLQLDPSSVVFAGDSGNDLEVFLSGLPAILVANTPEEIKEQARLRAKEKGELEKLFFAEGKYAEGVLEGCQHFGFS